MKDQAPLLLGIDIGTTGCKVTLFDLEGNPAGTAYREYPMHYPSPGCVEQDPGDWWRATVENTRAVLSSTGIHPARVAAVGVSCTNAIIPVDGSGRPLYNAIMQLDQRASPEVDWIKEKIGEDRIFAITGNRVAPGTYSLPTILWLMRRRPDVIEKTHKLLVPGGFIVCQLTGAFTIDSSRTATTMLADIRTARWSDELVEISGVPPAILPTPHHSRDLVGEVTPAAAAATGLIAGTPVVAGAMDTVAAALGAGATEAGNTFLAVGTTARLCLTVDQPRFDRRFVNCPNALPSRWLSIAPVNGAGVSLRWFRDTLGGPEVERARADGEDGYSALVDEAAGSEPGAGGVIYLPYLPGERSPIWDPNARGVFFGLHLRTGRGDLIRAVMEGVGFAVKHNTELWEKELAIPMGNLTLSGGVSKSPLWSQVFSDILEKPLQPLRVHETETLGAALLAGLGVGLIKDPLAVVQRVAAAGNVLHPDPRKARIYRPLFELFKRVYLDLKDDFARLDEILKHESGK